MEGSRTTMTDTRHHSTAAVIIGAGLAGLACARRLHEAGRPFVICEAADRVGGRVATDACGGFLLDRGFQVLPTAYLEARRVLDYRALDLRRFHPGALVRHGGKWHRLSDPFRHPIHGMRGVFNPVGTPADKLRVGLLRLRGFDLSGYDSGTSTLDALRSEGFSESMIDRFFRPFMAGVFLENRLETSVRKFEFVMRHFARGDIAIPARGMAEIPRQLAAALPAGAVRLRSRVASIDGHQVRLEDGRTLAAPAVVIATDASAAEPLLGTPGPAASFHSATCLYFSPRVAPVDEPVLMLDGEGAGPVNNLVVLSAVSPELVPPGRHLVSASVVDPVAAAAVDMEQQVRRQLAGWFGAEAGDWDLLRIDRIPRAVPCLQPVRPKPARVRAGIYQCGDHCGIASLDTALASGRAAAEALLDDFPG
jgi:phytoene dehydrogenase-like protein